MALIFHPIEHGNIFCKGNLCLILFKKKEKKKVKKLIAEILETETAKVPKRNTDIGLPVHELFRSYSHSE